MKKKVMKSQFHSNLLFIIVIFKGDIAKIKVATFIVIT